MVVQELTHWRLAGKVLGQHGGIDPTMKPSELFRRQVWDVSGGLRGHVAPQIYGLWALTIRTDSTGRTAAIIESRWRPCRVRRQLTRDNGDALQSEPAPGATTSMSEAALRTAHGLRRLLQGILIQIKIVDHVAGHEFIFLLGR